MTEGHLVECALREGPRRATYCLPTAAVLYRRMQQIEGIHILSEVRDMSELVPGAARLLWKP